MRLTKVLHKISQHRHDATRVLRRTQILIWGKKQTPRNDKYRQTGKVTIKQLKTVTNQHGSDGQPPIKLKNRISPFEKTIAFESQTRK